MAGEAGGGCLGPLILFMGGAMASNAIFGGFPKGFFDAVIHLGSLGSPVEAGRQSTVQPFAAASQIASGR